MNTKKMIAGAAVAGALVIGAGGVAVASGGGTGEVTNPGQEIQGMAAPTGGPQGGPEGHDPGGKHSEKIAEMEQLIQYDEIGMDQAEQIATGQAPGEVVEVKLKEKDGYPVYEVETFANSTLTEFYINAQNGEILEQEVEGAEEAGPMEGMPEGPIQDHDDDDHDLDDDHKHDDDHDEPEGPMSGEALPNTAGERE